MSSQRWAALGEPDAREWAAEQIRSAALGRIRRIDPVKRADRSAVLRITTDSDRLYLKASRVRAQHEPALTRFLAERFPAHFPAVVAIHASRGWMLTKEVCGTPLICESSLERWRVALHTLGRLQRELACEADELFELGCRSRTAAATASQVDLFIETWQRHGDPTESERASVTMAAAEWKRMFLETRAPLPDATLDHADLHPRNVVSGASGPVFLDWDGGAIGHPFWSPLILLGYVSRLSLPAAPHVRALRDAYLQAWSEDAPLTQLIDAFEAFRPLAALKYAAGLSRLLPGTVGPSERQDLCAAIRTCLDAALRPVGANA